MKAFALRKNKELPQIPLINLFAYLGELFGEDVKQFRFDRAEHSLPEVPAFWPLAQLLELHQVNSLSWQGADPTKAILRIRRHKVKALNIPKSLEPWLNIERISGQRPVLSHFDSLGEPVALDEDSKRHRIFKAFQKQVEGKHFDEIEDMEIPQEIEAWIVFDLEEDLIRLKHIPVAEPFNSKAQRVAEYVAFQQKFEAYYEEYWEDICTNELFDQLHSSYFQLQHNKELRLGLALGLISGKVGNVDFCNHLFRIPLKLDLQKSEISIWLDVEQSVQVDHSLEELLSKQFSRFAASSRLNQFREALEGIQEIGNEIHLELDFIRHHFYTAARKVLDIFSRGRDLFFEDEELNWQLETSATSNEVTLSFSPVLKLSQEGSRKAISQDAMNIMSKIKTLVANGESDLIPPFFKRLFSIDRSKNTIHAAFRNSSILGAKLNPSVSGHYQMEKPRYLFPLPTNKEQLSIADRLEAQPVITVQGPPGTGKSHTIANITSHYVSQGKSVLIVSKYAKALEVIKGKLPKEIQDLAVRCLKEGEGLEELKQAIDTIKDRLSRNYAEEELTRLKEKLERLDMSYDSQLRLIQSLIMLNQQPLTFANYGTQTTNTQNASEWGKLVLGKHIELLKDDWNAEWEEEILIDQFKQWLELASQAQPVDLELSQYEWPGISILPSPEQVDASLGKIQELSMQIDLERYAKVDPKKLDKGWKDDWKAIQPGIDRLEISRNLICHPRFDRGELQSLLFRLNPAIDQLRAAKKEMLQYDWELGEVAEWEPEVLLERLALLINKYKGKEKLGMLQKKTLSSQLKKFLQITINQLEVSSRRQLLIVQKYGDFKLQEKNLRITLGNYLSQFQLELDIKDVLHTADSLQEMLMAWHTLAGFNQKAKVNGLPVLDPKHPGWEQQTAFWKSLPIYLEYRRQEQNFEMVGGLWTSQFAHKEQDKSAERIGKALEDRDRNAYREAFDAYAQAKEKANLILALEEVERKLQDVLPLSLESLKPRIGDVELSMLGGQVEEEFFAKKVLDRLSKQDERLAELPNAFKRLEMLQKQRESVVSSLLAFQTWFELSKQIDPVQRAALSAWRSDLVNIGKGHGKNVVRNQHSARQNLQKARRAVPIWIMQQDTAIQYFNDPMPGQFDLLIIDEASQCDISMLNLIFRARKCMVVGDENQTSVAIPPNQFPLERTNQILDRYLNEHPFKEQFHLNHRNASIYTLCGVVYPNIVSLREHFRCRNEIINWSNENVYNDQIISLRSSIDNTWGKAVEAVYVEDVPEDKKKGQIVQHVVGYIQAIVEAYTSGKVAKLPSIGVLTLDSSNEAHRELLIKELSRNRLIKRYAKQMKLLVGTAREFQGDERDIMILTTAVGYSIKESNRIRAPRAVLGEDMRRIYNVASSRAKDKSILFHSLPDEVVASMNPSCLRRNLIDYYGDKPLVPAVKQSIDIISDEKLELVDWLKSLWKGEIQLDYALGPYVIDLALIDHHQKLAIFFDGSEAQKDVSNVLSDQLVLMRAGWKCYRLQELRWNLNPEKVKEEVSNWLGLT